MPNQTTQSETQRDGAGSVLSELAVLVRDKDTRQYFGPCLLHEPVLRELVGRVNRLDLTAHVKAYRETAEPDVGGLEPARFLTTAEDIAVIPLVGTFTKRGSSLFDGPATVQARHVLRAAAGAARAIVLLIDSPGGTLPGIDDLARDVAAIAQVKSVTAYIEDAGASAAYWIASQCTRIVANPAGWVGAIGVFATLIDSSAAAEQSGHKVHVVRSAAAKGQAVEGVVIDDEALAEAQRIIDEVHGQFVAAVARGRGLAPAAVAELADGRIHSAAEALRLKLIDQIGGFDQLVDSLAADLRADRPAELKPKGEAMTTAQGQTTPTEEEEKKKKKEEEELAAQEEEEKKKKEEEELVAQEEEEKKKKKEEEQPTAQAATVGQLKAALPEASSDFVLSCAEQGLTIDQAQGMYTAQRDQADNQPRPAPGGPGLRDAARPGARPRGDAEYVEARSRADARENHEFCNQARALSQERHCTVNEAMSDLAASDPDLYRSYREQFRVSEAEATR
ncbi:MAG: S49 family peptidase [Phycisphaerae bacterium]|nr:S49 family peptidase [Phycisphaerae bacterium]